jgi:hypothetical protein
VATLRDSGPSLASVLCRYNRRTSSREEGKGLGFRCRAPALSRALSRAPRVAASQKSRFHHGRSLSPVPMP